MFSKPTGPAFEETRYQITFLLEHEIIGEFGEKIITNPLNSSSDSYKKEMKQNVYIRSIHSSVAKYVQSYGMKVGDIIEKISVEGPDGFEHEVISLDDTTKSLLKDKRPITLTCSGKRNNNAMYWAWEKRKEYKREFSRGTPLICACQKGRLEDVKVLTAGHDANGSGMTLKEMVNQVGKEELGMVSTPLMAAAGCRVPREHVDIVQYLIEHCEANPNMTNPHGFNALHAAARNNKQNIDLIQVLLEHMSLDGINQKSEGYEYTPLDWAYRNSTKTKIAVPIRQDIIDLIRSKGGIRQEFNYNRH